MRTHTHRLWRAPDATTSSVAAACAALESAPPDAIARVEAVEYARVRAASRTAARTTRTDADAWERSTCDGRCACSVGDPLVQDGELALLAATLRRVQHSVHVLEYDARPPARRVRSTAR